MKKRGKKYNASVAKVDRNKEYTLADAVKILKETSYSKFDGTVEVAVNLGLDPRHADQNIRGAVSLPHGLGKAVRIVVFAKGDHATKAQAAGVEFVGGDDLAEKIQGGWMDFDQVIATPDMMAVVGKLGKVLGPRGLMPNPKVGTVTFDVEKVINELKAGRAEFRVEKAGIVHAPAGKVSFSEDKISENVSAIVDSLVRAKPSTAKGTYLKKVSLTSTMGPGIRVSTGEFL